MKSFAYLFPGQGSQVVGMGKPFLDHPLGKKYFEEANQVLGFDLRKLCLEGPPDQLTRTENAQPAILTISTIVHRIFQEQVEIQPCFVAGHSLGEYSALVAADALSFADAVQLVRQRGRYMQEVVPLGIGAMAAILGKSREEIEELCSSVSEEGSIVTPANFNCRGQIVIAGHKNAVQKILANAKGKLLDVSAPFHSPLMKPAAEKLRKDLASTTFNDAIFPVINNVSNDILTRADQFTISLEKQVCAPVQWESGIHIMIEKGVEHLIELGEGTILAGMMKRINKNVAITSISSQEDIETFLKTI